MSSKSKATKALRRENQDLIEMVESLRSYVTRLEDDIHQHQETNLEQESSSKDVTKSIEFLS